MLLSCLLTLVDSSSDELLACLGQEIYHNFVIPTLMASLDEAEIENTSKQTICNMAKVRKINLLETQDIEVGISDTNRSDYPKSVPLL